MRRIVLTGGPGAGKTFVTTRLAADFPDQFIQIPEAATQIYTAINTRWDQLNRDNRRDVQRQIYRLQIEQEERLRAENPNHIQLLDRGTVDGAIYWPEGPEDYWREMRSSFAEELARYDGVIWMQSSAELGLYDGRESNDFRVEDAPAAIASGQSLLAVWGGHHNLKKIGAFENVEDKIAAVRKLLGT